MESWWRRSWKIFPTTISRCSVSSTMIVTVSWPRPDGTTNYKCSRTFLCERLAPMFVPHVHHETTICMSGVCVQVRAALSPVKVRSLMASLFLLLFLLSGFSHFGPDIKPQILRSGCLIFCESLPGPRISLWRVFSFNRVNFVNPFEESDKLRFASTFQQSSISTHQDLYK